MHLEGLSGHRGSRIPLQHSVIAQKLSQKTNTHKKRLFFLGGGGVQRGTTATENRAAANHGEAEQTGLQLGYGAASMSVVRGNAWWAVQDCKS